LFTNGKVDLNAVVWDRTPLNWRIEYTIEHSNHRWLKTYVANPIGNLFALKYYSGCDRYLNENKKIKFDPCLSIIEN